MRARWPPPACASPQSTASPLPGRAWNACRPTWNRASGRWLAGASTWCWSPHYLWRPRFADVLDSVDDWYLHETFAVGQEKLGRPTNPDFLLQPGELFERCRSAQLHVLAYEDGVVNGARIQRIAARRRAGPLPLLESLIP
jgi:hypothetical protein